MVILRPDPSQFGSTSAKKSIDIPCTAIGFTRALMLASIPATVFTVFFRVGWGCYRESVVDSENNVRPIVARMAAAPEGSEEFWTAVEELRATLKASSQKMREQIDAAGPYFHSIP